MSGYTDKTPPQDAGEGRTAPFLHKPFTPASLAAKVREVLDRAE